MIWPYLQGRICASLLSVIGQGCACNIKLRVQHQNPIKAKEPEYCNATQTELPQ